MYIEHPYFYEGKYYANIDGEMIEITTHVFISKYDMTGIRKGSLALAEQVMSISTKCIIEKCGRVNKWSLDRVLKAVRIQMGMEGEGHDCRRI